MSLPAPYYSDERAGITIYHGDCRDILPHLGRFDLLLTDIPYNVGKAYGVHTDDLSHEAFIALWSEVARAAFDGASADADLVATVPLKNLPDCLSAVSGFRWRWPLFWHKPNAMLRGAAGTCLMDVAGWWSKGKGTIRPNGDDTFSRGVVAQPECGEHPCPKGYRFFSWLVGALRAETIVDPFCGTGTSLVAAKNHGRRAIGIELDERWCEVAVSRLRQEVLFGAQP